MTNRGYLLIACKDQPGIIAAVAHFVFEQGGNIIHSDQHSTGAQGGQFFLRIEFELPDLQERADTFQRAFQPIGDRFGMRWRLSLASKRKRLAIFVSKEDHCLQELLWQQRAGDLRADIAVVISNHTTLGPLVESWGIPFQCIPVTPDTRAEAEALQNPLLETMGVDTIVMARYMQIVTSDFIRRWENRIINIHHSFLPAFVGARPYAQAYARGVKIIGATAHYVTTELDAGPIIEQDIRRVDHRHAVDDLKRIGRQIERAVLARALEWHVEDRILVHGNKTIVFA